MTAATSMNEDALERLVEAREKLLGFTKARVGDADAAEDILQTSLTKAVAELPRLRHSDRLMPWFHAILRNSITDWYREKASGRTVSLPPGLDVEEEGIEAERQLCRCFEPLLTDLQPQYAELIQLLDFENQPVPAVARRLGITARNLKVRHHRARRALRQALEGSCRVCAEHHCIDCTCKAAN